jgi:spore germination protein GerM
MSDTAQKYLDERLEKAMESAKYRVTLFNQKENCKLKFKQSLTFSKNGGVFKVDESLISFVSTLISRGSESTILIDTNGNPIHITDLNEFFDDIVDRYHQATNDFLIDFKKIQASRKIAPMMDL